MDDNGCNKGIKIFVTAGEPAVDIFSSLPFSHVASAENCGFYVILVLITYFTPTSSFATETAPASLPFKTKLITIFGSDYSLPAPEGIICLLSCGILLHVHH